MKLLVETILTLGLIAIWLGVAMSASNATRAEAETAWSVQTPDDVAAAALKTTKPIQSGG